MFKDIRRLGQSVGNTLIRSGMQPLLGVFLSQRCPICDRPASQLFCIDCHRLINSDCYSVQGWAPAVVHGMTVGALGDYSGSLKQAILALKYKNKPEIARTLGCALAERWLMYSGDSGANFWIVPIPLHLNRRAQRGYNQAALIANSFSQVSRLPVMPHGLTRTQDTLPQHQLGQIERRRNLDSAFAIGKSLEKIQRKAKTAPPILLIDDIYTTGATARSAARTLKAAGFTVVGMLALARAVSDN